MLLYYVTFSVATTAYSLVQRTIVQSYEVVCLCRRRRYVILSENETLKTSTEVVNMRDILHLVC